MPYVGAVACDLVECDPGYIRTRTKTWFRDGIDAIGAQDLGKGDNEFTATAILFDTYANAKAWVNQMHALQGTVVSIVNTAATTYSDCLLISVGQPKWKPYIDPTTGATNRRCEIEIRAERRV